MARDPEGRFRGSAGEVGPRGLRGLRGEPGESSLLAAVYRVVTFDTLREFHVGCVDTISLTTINCPSAIRGYCQSIGYVGGFSQEVDFPKGDLEKSHAQYFSW